MLSCPCGPIPYTTDILIVGALPPFLRAVLLDKRPLFRTLRFKCLKSAIIYHPTLRRLALANGLNSFSAKDMW